MNPSSAALMKSNGSHVPRFWPVPCLALMSGCLRALKADEGAERVKSLLRKKEAHKMTNWKILGIVWPHRSPTQKIIRHCVALESGSRCSLLYKDLENNQLKKTPTIPWHDRSFQVFLPLWVDSVWNPGVGFWILGGASLHENKPGEYLFGRLVQDILISDT